VTTRVAITQPYVPGYRERLWELVIASLADAGIECRVFHGGDRHQERDIRDRGDGVEPRWASRVRCLTVQPVRSVPKFMFRRLPNTWRGRDVLLVTEMQGTNLNAWLRAALRQPYITLGHGISETTTQSFLADAAEDAMNAHAVRVLTYTETGRRHVLLATSLDEDRVTAFRNSTDTSRLQRAMATVTPEAERAFRKAHGMPEDARVSFFLGALNRFKGIDLLVDATRIALAADPRHWLVIAGDGEARKAVEALAEETGRVILLGQAGPETYAPAASLARRLVNPGRVGLVAVDALVMGLQILTTSRAAHAPEHEYLRPGIDVVEVEPTAAAVAGAMLADVKEKPRPDRVHPTVESAAETISRVILSAVREMREARDGGRSGPAGI
jgi:glycosyltransferase involved in cell wall biosynthesis